MSRQWWSEILTLTRYVLRGRILWFWIVASLVWPICYVWLLGAKGTSPIILTLNLALIPVSPIVFGLIGGQLTDMLQAKRAGEILRAWPTRPWLHTLAVATVLVAMSILSAFVTNLSTVVGTSSQFWQGSSWATTAWADGMLVVGLTDLLWLAGGMLLGSWVRGIWKILLSILAPMAWLIVTLMVSDNLGVRGASSAALLAPLEVAPFAWIAGHVSSIWGYGVYQHLLLDLGLLTLVMGFFLVAIAGFKTYGVDRGLLIAASVLGISVAGMATGLGGVLLRLGSINSYQTLAGAYHSGQRSNVKLLSAQMTILHMGFNQLNARATYRLVPEATVSRLKFFLNPALKVTAARLNGRLVPVSRLSITGWQVLNVPLVKDLPVSVKISFEGNPALQAPAHGLPHAAVFVATSGLLLPGGDWYPLMGTPAPSPIPWSLRIDNPPPVTVLSSLGLLRSSSHGALEASGVANNLSLIGGHLAGFGYHGVEMYVGADELTALRHALYPKRHGVTLAVRLGRLVSQLNPKPEGNLILPLGSGNPPYSRTVDPLIPEMWPQGVQLSFQAAGVIQTIDNTVAAKGMAVVYNGLGRRVLNLWMTHGMSSVMPAGTVLDRLVSSVLQVVDTNGHFDPQIFNHFPLKELPRVLMQVRMLHQRGRLTEKSVAATIQSISHQ